MAYMYVCPKCRSFFKLKSTGKQVKCPKCSHEYLQDLAIDHETWTALDSDARKKLISDRLEKKAVEVKPKEVKPPVTKKVVKKVVVKKVAVKAAPVAEAKEEPVKTVVPEAAPAAPVKEEPVRKKVVKKVVVKKKVIPKAEEAKAEAPKEEVPKEEISREETPKAEEAKSEEQKAEVPGTEEPTAQVSEIKKEASEVKEETENPEIKRETVPVPEEEGISLEGSPLEDVREKKEEKKEVKKEKVKLNRKYVRIVTISTAVIFIYLLTVTFIIPAFRINSELDMMYSAVPGDIVEFGRYKGNDEWVVLDRKDYWILCMSDYPIDGPVYFDEGWNDSKLRKWMNTSYINSTFNFFERLRITSTDVVKESYPGYGRDIGMDESDKVFIISDNELMAYLKRHKSAIQDVNDGSIRAVCWIRLN